MSSTTTRAVVTAALAAALTQLGATAHAAGGYAFREVNGVVSIEAEHFTTNQGYTVRTDDGPGGKAAGWSGDGWVYSDSEAAQRMDYRITFTKTGKHYIHLRALAGYDKDWNTTYEGKDNGFHAELDGVRFSGPGIFVQKKLKWVWWASEQDSGGQKPITFSVGATGTHTLSIVRREKLSRLDKIVLHDGRLGTTPASTITGEGPAETIDEGAKTTVITYPASGAALTEGQTYTLKGTGSGTLTWSYDANADGNPRTTIGTGSSVQFTAPTGVTGARTITVFLVADGGEASVKCTIVAPASNVAPSARDQTATVMQGDTVTLALDYSDGDGPGPYSFTITQKPGHGTLSGSGGTRTYEPGLSFSGTDAFTWKVNDGEDDSNVATVTIEVVSDSDGDGLPDWWETEFGLDPDEPDSDGDGIADGAEDEDEDGVTNAQEYQRGTNPTVADVPEGDEGVSCATATAAPASPWAFLALCAALCLSRRRRPCTRTAVSSTWRGFHNC